MRYLTCCILLFIWQSYSVAETPKSDEGACDEDWIFSNGFCYFFSKPEDTISANFAADKCLLSDAEYVYPKSSEELTFLQSQAKKMLAYGWTINIQKDFYADSFSISQKHSVFSQSIELFTPDPGTIPQLQKSYDKDNKCIALHVKDKLRSYPKKKITHISTEPCSVKLWVACQGKKSDFPDQVIDYERWFSRGDLVFWLTGKMADQAEAKTLCKQESLELITSIARLKRSLNGTYDLTPWWTGFVLGQNGPELEDGTSVDLTAAPWLPEEYKYDITTLLLLHSGKTRYALLTYEETKGLPYICKKRAVKDGVFGCPNLWIRAGRSCYFLNKDAVQWRKAKETCEARGSHLLSINSLDERLWIETVASGYLPYTWTSANDLTTEGNFRWHDGTAINDTLLPWLKAPFGEYWRIYEEKCVAYNARSGSFFSAHCKSFFSPACQYELGEGKTQCENNWNELDRTCYFMDTKREKISYLRLEHYCRTILKDTRAVPIMVKTKEVFDFLSKIAESDKYMYISIWLGMTQGDTMDSWRWYDSTLVDFSVFGLKDQPDNGDGGTPENCVAMNSVLHAFDKNCNNSLSFICEKDLPAVAAVGPIPDSATYLHIVMFVPVFSVFIGLVGKHLIS